MSEEPGEEERSFEERLKAARSRQGLDAPTALAGQPVRRPRRHESLMGIGLRVGIELVSALVVAVAIGYGLDYLFGTRPILTAVFVLLGGAAGVLNVWRVFAPRPTTQDRRTSRRTERGTIGGGRRIDRRARPVQAGTRAGRHRRFGELHPGQPDDGRRGPAHVRPAVDRHATARDGAGTAAVGRGDGLRNRARDVHRDDRPRRPRILSVRLHAVLLHPVRQPARRLPATSSPSPATSR